MTLRSLMLGIALAAAACSPVGESPMPTLVLEPDDELRPLVLELTRRWSTAAGLPIEVRASGVTVRSVTEAINPQGKRVCGFTVSDGVGPKSITVAESPPPGRCSSMPVVIGHEIGHALCRLHNAGDCHAPSGMMRESGPDDAIDAATLAAVCEFAPCTAFVPE